MNKAKKARKSGLFLMMIGFLLILAAAGLTGKNLLESRQADVASTEVMDALRLEMPKQQIARASVADYIAHADTTMPLVDVAEDADLIQQMEIPLYLLDPKIPMPLKLINGRNYVGTVTVPVLGLELPVLNDCTYSGLKIAPNRWSGSVYANDMVICAHNYQRHFGTLKNLQPGDLVTFTDMDGNIFCYNVVLVEVLQPESVDEMENSEYDLTLFTCTIGGATRVTVRCMRDTEL